MIKYELLTKSNFNEHSLDLYERRQDVKKVYRRNEDEYILVELPYVEDWDLDKKRQVAISISSDECISYVALEEGKVIGFIGLIKKLNNNYMILDLMQVATTYRGKGIGRQLFHLGKEEAKRAGAEALYISACSSEETIVFYKAMGAKLTSNPIREIADDEPFDLQMVCRV